MIVGDFFKTKKKDVTILWESQRNLTADILSEKIQKYFPSFNVEIFDENNNNLINYENIPSSNELGSASLANEQAREIIINNNPAIICCNDRRRREFFASQNFVKNNFTFSIEENYRIFKEKNGYSGFYEKLFIKITHNDSFQISYACAVEYDQTVNQELFANSISKVYRSTDNLSLKIKFIPEYFYEGEINSFLIKAKAINGSNSIDLNPIFIEDIHGKWLNTVDDTKILTLPFIENETVEEATYLNIDIYPLLPFQTAIIKSISDNQDLNVFISKYLKYKLSYNNLYKSGSILEAVNFEGYFYMFNPESYDKIAWPKNEYLLNGINYEKYFPLSKNENNLNTICLYTPNLPESSVLEVSNINLNESIGYYDKNLSSFYDATLDLPYFKKLNILNIKILNIEEIDQEYIAYLEFRTSLTIGQDILINNISSNLIYEKKYYQNINDINYLCLLFSIRYNKFINSELQNEQIIKEKRLINFSFKYNN